MDGWMDEWMDGRASGTYTELIRPVPEDAIAEVS